MKPWPEPSAVVAMAAEGSIVDRISALPVLGHLIIRIYWYRHLNTAHQTWTTEALVSDLGSDPPSERVNLDVICDVHVVAPKLWDLEWRGSSFESNRHHLEGVASHIQRLAVFFDNSKGVPLMQKFDSVHELHITLATPVVCQLVLLTYYIY